jgi:hypothetical protein
MRAAQLGIALMGACVLAPCAALAESPTADDRIAISADGGSLSGTDGGGGASVGWLHNFDADSLVSVAAEHQALSDAHWTFGSVAGALTTGPENQRYTFSAEAHEGAGDDGPHPFHYAIEAAAVTGTYFHRWSAQFEDRQIDVETTHGNLPKLGFSYLWGPHVMTSVSYSYSISGNLGTHLTAVRIDTYGAKLNYLAGAAFGQASPSILGIGFVLPPRQLKEGYVGIAKPFPHLRSDLTVVADYQDLSGSRRATLTVSYIFHVRAAGAPR